ncbi:sterol desaturase family protein [Roseomonas sp. NAR14]|uniref:Sterol desaturase family protein n=1 Tax=Roseomonas acroporae TaxID=2937791 RepID=A0A9X1Y382_9PROT|nr:sterol desaturase family protein [Roseomonas acroporae]MCK8783349.1 sterol desaturase family protein [Roseomonas acroporae]
MLNDLYAALSGAYTASIEWVFEGAVIPALYALGLMEWAEDAFDWTGFAFFGLVQVLVVYAVCRPLEAWRPVERWADRRVVWSDVAYTLLTRLGLLPLIAFVAFASAQSALNGWLVGHGLVMPTLDSLIPGLRDYPLLALLLYLVILDFGAYVMHWLQHHLPWWWALHSVHHAQQQMTFWTDDRNHILDEVISACWTGALALLIGVPPAQFPVIVLLSRLVEALSHANVRLSFGRIGERLLVSPRFHRLHHGVLSVGERGRNYAVLFPVWDWIFGTADFDRSRYPRTGDPEALEEVTRGSWFQQQVAGMRQLGAAVWRSLRWRGGERPRTG